jgi:hypothetical protein
MNSLTTRYILVMRHAEKPGMPNDPNLSEAGYARANELATYIPDTFGKPDVIIAAENSLESHRPVETVTPLAHHLAPPLTVLTPYTDKQFEEAAKLMLTGEGYRDRPLIVCCWHHEKIPHLMKALECEEGSFPDLWPDDLFNLILKVGIHSSGPNTVEEIREPF